MKRIHLFYILLFCISTSTLFAQTTREEMLADVKKTAGVYLAYPTEFAPLTPAPKGYKPFYVSHYGRHGSRYLIGDRDYKWILDLLDEAHAASALTPLGEEVRGRMQQVWAEAEGHGGDLTPLGVRQHQGIAERMFRNFPEAFAGNKSISARSTVVLRCAMSMVAFGDQLKGLNPALRISYEASPKYMSYLNYHADEANRFTHGEQGPWVEAYRKFEQSQTRPDRLISSLFCDAEFVRCKVNPHNLMWGLYWVASDAQDTENQISFYDIFQPEELFDLWQCINYRFYVSDANHADGRGLVTANAKPLLRNILDSANEAIREGNIAATLRFGHDGNVIPLLALLQIEHFNVSVNRPEGLYKVWCDFKAVPMAGNIQLIFFRKVKGSPDDILVKVLHNEQEVHIPVATDIFPYYRWSDVEQFYREIAK